MSIKCLIVDDEPPAHKVLESYISKINKLSLVGNCYNAIEAINCINEQDVDLIFLDINMPELSGLEMLQTLTKPPAVILTTAYSQFALDSYEFGVVDYLLKPIRFDRFLKAVNRALDQQSPTEPIHNSSEKEGEKEAFFFIKADGVQHKIEYDDLFFLESKGNFVQLYLSEGKLLTADTLKNMDSKLQTKGFLRIHKSYMVNLSKVKGKEGNQLLIRNTKVPIGNSYRQIVLKALGLSL